MKFYLVGGAVRDLAMDKIPNDKDYVIVGATEVDIRALIKKGYEQVGKDFPVFIHPETKAEYALARIERKTGVGYNGFECTTENVTLEEDLKRRDFTMNAIAYDYQNNIIIDPFKGKKDIQDKIIKHVSPAFSEDPVRVLRAARFANTYQFNIHKSTKTLIKKMVKSGELNHLTKERVLLEFTKTLNNSHRVDIFINTLVELGVWDVLFPELKDISKHHIHFVNKVIQNSAVQDRDKLFWASLFYLKPELYETANKRLTFQHNTTKFHQVLQKAKKGLQSINKMKPQEIVEFFDKCNFKNFGADVCIYSIFDVLQCRTSNQLFSELAIKLFDLYNSIDAEVELIKAGNPKGLEAKECVKQARIKKISKFLE